MRLLLVLVVLSVPLRAAWADAARTLDLASVPSTSERLRRVHGSAGNGSLGTPVAGGVDCDGDGIPDYALASFRADPLGRSDAGEVYLAFGDGGLAGSLDTAGFDPGILKFAGAGPRETAGSEIWMDDVTGDGIGDLLIARQNFRAPSPDRPGAGALTIVVGGPQLRTRAAQLGYVDLAAPGGDLVLTTVTGPTELARLGIWMRTGDVDGDGIADIVTAADQQDAGRGTHSGVGYVIRGGPHLAQGGQVDLAGFGATALAGNLARVLPPAGSAHFHLGATCQIGDLDGDDRGEVMLASALTRGGASVFADGAPAGSAHSTGGASRGRLFILWDELFPAGPWPAGWTLDLELAGPLVSEIRGGPLGVRFGEEILAGEDYDLDGAQDLFVGDITGDGTAAQSRRSSGTGHVLFNARQLKGQSVSVDQLPVGVAHTRMLGAQPGDIAGDTALHGDFDGDGIADLGIGSPHADPLGRLDAGSMHVLHGRVGGWPELVDLRQLPDEADLKVSEIHGARGRDGSDGGDVLCYSAASGDINRDGSVDLLVNEMLGNGVSPAAEDAGNLIILDGRLLRDGPAIPLFPYQ